jgi:hypothetical protein
MSFIKHEDLTKFDPSMPDKLKAADFEHYKDTGYDFEYGWWAGDHTSMHLLPHDYGYWIILCRHESGENRKLNIGSSNSAEEIIALRDAMEKLF